MAKKPYPSEVLDRYIVRFPAGMRDRVAESAKRHGRSMNAEIIHILHDYYMRQEFHDKLVDSADLQLDGERLSPDQLDQLTTKMQPDPRVAGAFADLIIRRLSETLIFEMKPFELSNEESVFSDYGSALSVPVGSGKTSSFLKMIPHLVLPDADRLDVDKKNPAPISKPKKSSTAAKNGSETPRKGSRKSPNN